MSKENSFTFELQGIRFELIIQENGFTIWNKTIKQWHLDTSTIFKDGTFRTGIPTRLIYNAVKTGFEFCILPEGYEITSID